MKPDEILREVRDAREAYAVQFRGNIRALMDDLRRRGAASNRQTITRSPKPSQKSTVTSHQEDQ